MEKQLLQSRISIMLPQIQPHFPYNSLTAIRQLCDIDPPKAKQAVTHAVFLVIIKTYNITLRWI